MGRIGHDAFCAHTLQEGIRQASSGGFDAVFLDVRLPDGNAVRLDGKMIDRPVIERARSILQSAGKA